jgi:hypothetical protein
MLRDLRGWGEAPGCTTAGFVNDQLVTSIAFKELPLPITRSHSSTTITGGEVESNKLTARYYCVRQLPGYNHDAVRRQTTEYIHVITHGGRGSGHTAEQRNSEKLSVAGSSAAGMILSQLYQSTHCQCPASVSLRFNAISHNVAFQNGSPPNIRMHRISPHTSYIPSPS